MTASGTTTPAKPRVTLLVERQARSGEAWRRVRRLTLETIDGAWQTALSLSAVGRYRFIVTTAADDLNAAGASPLRTARVAPAPRRTRWRATPGASTAPMRAATSPLSSAARPARVSAHPSDDRSPPLKRITSRRACSSTWTPSETSPG